MKKSSAIFILCLISNFVFSQDLIYTVSGELNAQKTALDSILVENLSNGTRSMFGNLPAQQYYQINLTKNAYWGTVGINSENKIPSFVESQNLPGLLVVSWYGSSPIDVKLTVFTVSGQTVYTSDRKMVFPGNAINILLGSQGVFLVKLESPIGTQTFKTVGSGLARNYDVSVSEARLVKAIVKSSQIASASEFSFLPGDSLRFSVYKNTCYARPKGLKIINSDNVNFLLDKSTVATTGISDAFVSLDENTTNVIAFNEVTGTIKLDYSGDKPELNQGDIITVDADTMGYLRKVVKTTATAGQITVETVQAYFNDIFVDKVVKLNTGLMNPGVQLKSNSSLKEISSALTDENGYIHPVEVIYHGENGQIITKSALTGYGEDEEIIPIISKNYDLATDLYGKKEDNIHFFVDEGHLILTSNAVFEFKHHYEGEITPDTKIAVGELDYFRFYLENKADFLTKLALDMNASDEKNETKKLIDLQKVTAKFIIPPGIPMWISFDVDIFGRYNFTADASAHANWGFESTYTINLGATYTKATNSFVPFKEFTPVNNVFPLDINAEANVFARLELYPRTEIMFYGIYGPYSEIVPYVQSNFNAKLQSQITGAGSETFLAWNSGVDLGLDFRVGTKLDFLFGLNKEFGPSIINGPVWPLWQSPTDISLTTTLPADAEVGKEILLNFKVSDLKKFAAPLCPIYIEGDGKFSKQILFTNISGEASVNWTLKNEVGKNDFTATIYKADKSVINTITGSVTGTIAEPYSITKVSGDNQAGTLGEPLTKPIVVIVKDQTGNLFEGAIVNFKANNGGFVSQAQVMSDKDGIASVIWTLGTVDIEQTLIVEAFKSDNKTPLEGSFITFTTKIAEPYSIAKVSGDKQSGILSQPLSKPIVVIVKDQAGNPFKGAKVNFAANNGGSVSQEQVTTGTDGIASVTWTLGTTDKTQTATVSAVKSDNKTPLLDSPLSFTASTTPNEIGTFTDSRDGHIYNWVKIGTQVWMAENLAYLPSVSPSNQGSQTAPYYYVYEYQGTDVAAANKNANYTTYGVLYNWPAARTACPPGWHLPGDDEWTALTNFLGGIVVAGGKMKETGTAHWLSPNTGATNESGFSALPGGFRNESYGSFINVGEYCMWWSSKEYYSSWAWNRYLYYNTADVIRLDYHKAYGFSVRCVRD